MEKYFSVKRIAQVAVMAALYAVLTFLIAPISYGLIQFRVSEFLKVFVLFHPILALGIGIGTFFANLFSPITGPWELIFMPVSDFLGGIIAWYLYEKLLNHRLIFIPMVVYALTTALSVGLMLSMYGLGGFWLASGLVFVSEVVILLGGIPVANAINRALQAKGFIW